MEELLNFIREYEKRYDPENATIAEQLRYRAFNSTKTHSEWLQLEKDMQEYASTNPPEAERKILFDFAEMVGMTCSAIRLMQNDSEDTVK
ncbi:MAG: hypothetical protein Q4D90_02595 [bacterium]|nr:hypothetical protein [bacterium]